MRRAAISQELPGNFVSAVTHSATRSRNTVWEPGTELLYAVSAKDAHCELKDPAVFRHRLGDGIGTSDGVVGAPSSGRASFIGLFFKTTSCLFISPRSTNTRSSKSDSCSTASTQSE